MIARWELFAVPVVLNDYGDDDDDDDDLCRDMQRVCACVINDKPARFLFRSSAKRVASIYDRMIPGMHFYVVPVTARRNR